MKNTNYRKIAVVLLALIGMFLAPVLFAEEEKTVLDRVKIVDNPELAELIQIAIDNMPLKSVSASDTTDKRRELEYEAQITKAKTIRIVTETYAQIKLLDEKIKQVGIKLDESKNTHDIARELLLAKSALEAERLTKIAELRETLNWTPWAPFNTKDEKDLNTWIHLEVLDDVIRMCELNKPFDINRCNVSFNSYDDTIKYLEKIYKQTSTMPIRISLSSTEKGMALANKLQDNMKLIAKNSKSDFLTDLKAGIKLRGTSYPSILILDKENIKFKNTDYEYNSSAKNFANRIKWDLQRPGAIPSVYQITYRDINLKDKAKEIEDAMNDVIQKLGYAKYASVKVNEDIPANNKKPQ